MVYGRLDVFWPDGKFESFELSADSVSVGRSSGNTITLDTDTISRYHFSITRQHESAQITDLDSANGTFVDSERLTSNQARPLQGGEEIQIGHLRMIYHAIDDMPTLPVSTVSDDTQRIEREAHGFKLDAYGPDIAVPPGSHTSAELTITNTTKQSQRFIVTVTGMPEGWVRINRPEPEVAPGESSPVLISIKPFRKSDSTPGNYTLKVTVAHKDQPDKKLEVEVPALILPYSGFGMALGSSKIASGEQFRLHMHNQGSIGLPLYVTGRSKKDRLNFGIASPQVILAAGQRLVLQGDIRPKRGRLFGPVREYPFEIIVRSRDDAAFLAAIPGRFVEKPVLPGWAAFVIGTLVTTVIGLALLALLMIVNAPQDDPTITGFGPGGAQIARGNILTLNWEVNDADNLSLTVINAAAGTSTVTLPADASSVDFDTTNYTGETILQLQASNDAGAARQEITINVLQPLTIESFEVIPNVLVLNVIQEVVVRWNIPGAASVQIVGLEGLEFSTTAIAPSYGPSGEITATGIPGADFAIMLNAQNDNGESLQQTAVIQLVNAECRPTSGSLTLFASPDTAANVVSTVQEGTLLFVDRQDDTGVWLRAQPVGGVAGWGERARMTCADNFDPDNLRVEVVVVQPSLTPAPTTPAPATATPRNPTNPAPTPRANNAPAATITPAG